MRIWIRNTVCSLIAVFALANFSGAQEPPVADAQPVESPAKDGEPPKPADQPSPETKKDSTEANKPVAEKPVAEKKSLGRRAGTKEEAKKEAKTKVQLLALSGSYNDLESGVPFDPTSILLGGGGGKVKSFYKLCDYIDDLAKNDSINFVVFDLSDTSLSMNPAQLDEFTRRLTKLKASGKKLYAWLETASTVSLAIAASCDEIIMADFGGIDFPSSSMQTIFYREAMDLLGVKASVVRAGDFKGAVEPYMNSTMSEHLKKHYVDMLTSVNDAVVSIVAKGRGLTSAQVREIQKKRMLLPQEAISRKLVDRLAPYGSMKQTIEGIIGKPVEWVTPTAKPKKELSFFDVMGQVMAGPKESKTAKLRDASIVVMHLSGDIVDGKKAIPGSIVSGASVDAIEELIADDKVMGVVVRINSPGGSATASESIRQALKKLADKKPTVVSMGEMAASGGYWVSCIGVPVYAEQGTITGSIGVFSMKLSVGSMLRRLGVHVESIALDPSAEAFSPDKAWSEDDEKVMQEAIDDVYTRFLRLVSDSRRLDVEVVKSLAGGRVWSGTQAKANGLVDELGGLDDCLAVVAKKAKLEKYEVVHRPEVSSGLDLLELLGEGEEDAIQWSSTANATLRLLQKQGFQLDTLRLLLRHSEQSIHRHPTIWALHPAEIRILP